MNLPNLLSILRILFIPVFINLLIYHYHGWALAVFLAAGLTDSLDGLIARLTNQRTRLGTYLDPMADKLLLTASFLALGILQIIPVWSAVVVVSRDIILILGALILHLTQTQMEISPTFLGKSTTALQLIYVALVLLAAVVRGSTVSLFPVLVVTVGLTILSGLHYIYRGIHHLNSEQV
ncbi:MAG TPA: CDP-alcohol phosphatidyltransferase family protein [Nitrospiria bacterium]|jgi:cardiolipin synthase|nr:CDP-alcohol phosphatidyltransferase family protein [Nitrospiria bacterium]